MKDTTAIEVGAEMVFSLTPSLQALPFIANEIKIEVIQLSGLGCDVDLSAPYYRRVHQDTIRINGEEIDPNRAYTMAVVENLGPVLGESINKLCVAFDENNKVVQLLEDDPSTGKPYTHTGVLSYKALQDYLAAMTTPDIPVEEGTITGRLVRTVQPDLCVNATDISVSRAALGSPAQISVKVRNNGTHGVESANVRVLIDYTPWDLTDQPDNHAIYEGFGPGYLGSLVEVGRTTITDVGPHPAVKNLTFTWNVPPELPPGSYTVHVRVEDIVGSGIDPNTGETYIDMLPDNNTGEVVMTYFDVVSGP